MIPSLSTPINPQPYGNPKLLRKPQTYMEAPNFRLLDQSLNFGNSWDADDLQLARGAGRYRYEPLGLRHSLCFDLGRASWFRDQFSAFFFGLGKGFRV